MSKGNEDLAKSPSAPAEKRAIAFFDGQNLFRAAKEAFRIEFPDFDPMMLATEICQSKSWLLRGLNFYTGIPPIDRDPFWHGFWSRKLAQIGKQGKVFNRLLRYQRKEIRFGHGGSVEAEFPVEKGVDVRIAVDVIRLAIHQSYDVALIFSQDQDLSEATDEVKLIATEQGRTIEVASAFPVSNLRSSHSLRGINRTTWIPFDLPLYDKCRDPRDYRVPKH